MTYIPNTVYCECGRSSISSSDNVKLGPVRCHLCPEPKVIKHEGGLIATVDEWCHRRCHYGSNPQFPWLWWRHPLDSAWHLLFRPLCNYRDRSVLGLPPGFTDPQGSL